MNYRNLLNTGLVKACSDRSILCLDISAQYESLKQIEKLNHAVRSRGPTIMLSTGLTPGLTNLPAQPELPAGVWHTHQFVRDIPHFVHSIQQYYPGFRFTENPEEEWS